MVPKETFTFILGLHSRAFARRYKSALADLLSIDINYFSLALVKVNERNREA